jgi:hypothetical protein
MLPVLATMDKQFSKHGLEVVTVCIGASAEEARDAARRAKANVGILLDADGLAASSYQVRGTPTTYLIDGDGVIRMRQVGYGEAQKNRLRTAIVDLLMD